jgi:hypothetical protein
LWDVEDCVENLGDDFELKVVGEGAMEYGDPRVLRSDGDLPGVNNGPMGEDVFGMSGSVGGRNEESSTVKGECLPSPS